MDGKVRGQSRTIGKLLLQKEHLGQAQACSCRLTICLMMMQLFVNIFSTHQSAYIHHKDLNIGSFKSTERT